VFFLCSLILTALIGCAHWRSIVLKPVTILSLPEYTKTVVTNDDNEIVYPHYVLVVNKDIYLPDPSKTKVLHYRRGGEFVTTIGSNASTGSYAVTVKTYSYSVTNNGIVRVYHQTNRITNYSALSSGLTEVEYLTVDTNNTLYVVDTIEKSHIDWTGEKSFIKVYNRDGSLNTILGRDGSIMSHNTLTKPFYNIHAIMINKFNELIVLCVSGTGWTVYCYRDGILKNTAVFNQKLNTAALKRLFKEVPDNGIIGYSVTGMDVSPVKDTIIIAFDTVDDEQKIVDHRIYRFALAGEQLPVLLYRGNDSDELFYSASQDGLLYLSKYLGNYTMQFSLIGNKGSLLTRKIIRNENVHSAEYISRPMIGPHDEIYQVQVEENILNVVVWE